MSIIEIVMRLNDIQFELIEETDHEEIENMVSRLIQDIIDGGPNKEMEW